jgi:hypothetical protein
MNKDQGWIVCATNEKIDMVRAIGHVTAPPPDLSLISAASSGFLLSYNERYFYVIEPNEGDVPRGAPSGGAPVAAPGALVPRKQREIQLGCSDGTFPLYLSYAGFRGTWSGSVGNPAEYRRYARECLELAGSSQVRRARDALHHMAHVWLRLAQEAEVQISSSSPEEHQHENDRA